MQRKTTNKQLKRQKSRAFGMRAETLAAIFLMLKGYRILERNYLEGGGEIDLIVQKGRVIAFVEVKARTNHGAALMAIDNRKLERIAKAARSWVIRAQSYDTLSLRFDAVLVAPSSWPRHRINIAELPSLF